jgi:hypothetical protein
MCRGCGDDYFQDRQRPELTSAMAELAEEIAQANTEYKLSYGGLHIVISDWNLAADHIEWCLSADNTHERGVTDQERRIAESLLAMSEAERYLVMDRAEIRGHELAQRG